MFDWDHYKVFSDEIYAKLPEVKPLLKDSAKRTIVSRVYYTYFHKVKQINEYFAFKSSIYSKDSHEESILKIKKYKTDKLDKSELSKLYDDLIELKGYRNQADYKASINFSDEKMEYIMADLVGNIEKLLNRLM